MVDYFQLLGSTYWKLAFSMLLYSVTNTYSILIYCSLLVSLVGMFAIDSDVAFFEVQNLRFYIITIIFGRSWKKTR
jgi:hypothetical protein